MSNDQKKQEKDRVWQAIQYSNLIRYVSSGTYYARFRVHGKLIGCYNVDIELLDGVRKDVCGRYLAEVYGEPERGAALQDLVPDRRLRR